MATVLMLFATEDEPQSKKLRDLLQARLGTSYNLTTIKDVLAEGNSLNDELSTSSCVILVVSQQSGDLLKQKNAQKDCSGGIVMFDGALVREHIEEKNLMDKMVVVQFNNDLKESIPAGFDASKAFVFEGSAEGEDKAAILDQVVDTVKGIVSSKANEKCKKKEKKKKKCTQM